MTPESAIFLAQACRCLSDARLLEAAGIRRLVLREAYLAAFHAAQAMIFELDNKVVKTHSGVRTEFARLAMGNPELTPSATQFLAKAYRWKETADYSFLGSPNDDFDGANLSEAIESAASVLASVKRVLQAHARNQ